ncbi:hypothetical protein PF049_06100 [Erythrobacteraceae bacterium WH01K]|nr:hypothetical protein PF049_06100 [Erythrobacteraceae bacterium WH01K]
MDFIFILLLSGSACLASTYAIRSVTSSLRTLLHNVGQKCRTVELDAEFGEAVRLTKHSKIVHERLQS